MPSRLFSFALLLPLLFSAAMQAAAVPELHARADALNLAKQPYWRLLLRYEKASSASGWQSQTASTIFFVSPEGRDNPQAELHALLDALDQPVADAAPACRFPARVAWLREHLGDAAIPHFHCPALTTWEEAIKPEQATLVFASDFLNNPSSMFGHSFLRLDRAEQTEDTRLLAYALNYAAVPRTKNPVAYVWNGLTGGYPGIYSLTPYYDKVKEYSDMESRDLWEYQLSFTPAELKRLLDHAWELRNVEFPYFFLSRNCSYELLALFEVARPGLQMRKDFPVHAIPSDTVRRVLAEPGLLHKVVYRPSAQRRLLQDSKDNPHAVNIEARLLASDPQRPALPEPQQNAAALEAAYDFRYYQFLAGDQTTEARQDLRTLLQRRAALDVPDQRTTPPQPAVDPASGHRTARVALTAGREYGANYLGLKLRPAYHDLLDAPGGYRHGARIDFLDGELRLDDEHKALRLQQLNILSIDSLTAWDPFFRPWSWFLGTGLRQAAVDRQGNFSTEESHGVAYFDFGGGGDIAINDELECYGQLATTAESGGALEHGWRAGVGPRLGCLYSQSRWRLRLQVDSRYFNDVGLQTRSMLEGQFDLSPNDGLRIGLGQLQNSQERSGIVEAAWLHYF